MKAYKITGKLGDICSFVGGNEVKKGDMVYLHSESDMKQESVAKTQGEKHMSMIIIKTWLDSGANAYSCYETEFEIDEAEWNAMSEEEKDEYAKEIAWDRMDWGWKLKEKNGGQA